jgi:hypothetical protein
MPLVVQELPTIPGYLCSPCASLDNNTAGATSGTGTAYHSGVPMFSMFVLGFVLCFTDQYLFVVPFQWATVLSVPFSIYGVWLPLWYHQTFLDECFMYDIPAPCIINYQERIGMSFNQFNPATYVCLSETRAWICNAMCLGGLLC